jgi:hypothetical protein
MDDSAVEDNCSLVQLSEAFVSFGIGINSKRCFAFVRTISLSSGRVNFKERSWCFASYILLVWSYEFCSMNYEYNRRIC